MNELKGIPEEEPILVLNKDGKPLMPTCRHAHAQRLLDKGKAYLMSTTPWAIRLKYQIENPKTQPITIGIDPGRQNIGVGVAANDTHLVIHRAKLETDNEQVTRHMTDRRQHRQAIRHGERLRRKRRAKANHQQNQQITRDNGRMLASCEEMIPVKDIINTEARFSNRKRPEGWLTPTANNLVQSHISLVKRIMRLVPVTDCCLELNKFAFMRMEDGTVRGVDFRNGRMRGFASMHEYVSCLQGGVCHMPGCQAPIEHYHHVLPRSKGGSDRPENIVGLCEDCHRRVHLGELRVIGLEGERKPFAAVSVLNQAIPSIYRELVNLFGEGHVRMCSGYETKLARERLGLGKDHDVDGLAIIAACMGWGELRGAGSCHCCSVRRFRRHDRARVQTQRERTYRLDGRIVAKNRKPRFEQPKSCSALSEAGLSRGEVSQLRVTPSKRSYNDLGRVMPGAVFEVEGHGVCVMTGQQNNGTRYFFNGQVIFPDGKTRSIAAGRCRQLAHNRGVTYIKYES